VLARPSREDFVPGRYYGERIERVIWEWPIHYEELGPYFDAAERLFRVAGNGAQPVPCLEQPAAPYDFSLPALEPFNEELAAAIGSCGLVPWRLPLAIDFDGCLRCARCPGYYCPNQSRVSSLNAALRPAIEQHGAELWSGCDAERLVPSANGRVGRLSVVERRSGARHELTAEAFVIAAGAIGTPVLLERSGLGARSGQVGRNYMFHAGAVAAGVFRRPPGLADRFGKQLGFTDLYLGGEGFPHKLGYAQMLPVPGPLTLADEAPVPLPGWLARPVFDRTVLLAGLVEDLPSAENRVSVAGAAGIRIRHRFGEYDRFRSAYYLRRLKGVMRRAGATLVLGALNVRDDLHVAHQVGTCRFGRDPRHAVLDAGCRLHDCDNVWVADGSFMPTSLGVGPALTIVANALRVADGILGRSSPQ
jgi:choline dehydrogenase-like flavoprotein